jgi:hypothetical protein
MRDLSSLAEQIRAVRQAQRRFIGHWRLEQVIIGPELLDHLADDMAAAHRELDGEGLDAAAADSDVMTQTPGRDGWGYPRSQLWSM